MTRKMKDSGVEWIGMIPDGWNVGRLGAVLADRNESNNPVKTDVILSLTNDRGVILYADKGNQGNKSKDDITQYKLAYPNDIVLNSMNVVIGSVGLSPYFGAVSPVYYMLYPRNDKTTSIRFFDYIFQTTVFQQSLRGYGNGIMEIRMRIQMQKLKTVMLAYPSKEEQERIVRILDAKCASIDDVIAKTTESIEEYKKLKQAVITEAVTKGVRGKRPMKDSDVDWIGQIPKEWDVVALRYLGQCQNGISKGAEFFGSGYPFVSYSDVYKNIELPKSVDGLVQSTDEERERYSVKRGDIFFTRTSETIEEIGFTSVCTKDIENATFAGFLIRVRPIDDSLNPDYAKYYFRSDIHRRYFVKEMIIVIRASLGQELLKKLPVLLPSKEEQREIADYLDSKCAAIDTLISKKQQFIDELTAYKKSLIYEFVTGKKEVPA